MKQVKIKAVDLAGIHAVLCKIPDNVTAELLAPQLASLLRYPANQSDGIKINYGLVAKLKCNKVIEASETFADLSLPDKATIYVVPEITAAQVDNKVESENTIEAENNEQPISIEVIEELSLLHDDKLNLSPDIRMTANAHRKIESISMIDRSVECAGILLGDVTIESGKRVIHITNAVYSNDVESTSSSVKITHSAWAAMLKEKDEEYRNLRILGWFHSHAGWGVFMSDADVFLQKCFFPHPNMIAFVIDPTKGNDSIFYWSNGKISQYPCYALEADPVDHSLEIKSDDNNARFNLLKVSVIIALIAIIAVGLLFIIPHNKSDNSRTIERNVRTVRKIQQMTVKKTVSQKKAAKPADRTYFLGKGENFWIISGRVYNNASLASALAKYNGLDSRSGLHIGQKIKLPSKDVLIKLNK